jgi:hypothetical protein
MIVAAGRFGRGSGVDAIEIAYTILLVVVFLVVGWFSLYVVYKLYQGQR